MLEEIYKKWAGNNIRNAAMDGKWNDPGMTGDWGVEGWLNAVEQGTGLAGLLLSQGSKEELMDRIFIDIMAGINAKENKGDINYKCAQQFAQNHPEIVIRVAHSQPASFLDGAMVENIFNVTSLEGQDALRQKVAEEVSSKKSMRSSLQESSIGNVMQGDAAAKLLAERRQKTEETQKGGRAK